MRKFPRLIASSCLLLALGCGTSDNRQTLAGQVTFPGGDVSQLAGHSIELAHTTDATVRATGTLGADGRFTVESLENGKVRQGAKPGTYKARLVFSDEAKRPVIAARFTKFETSGWQVQVPPQGDVTLTISAK